MTKAELIEKIWDGIPIYRRSQIRKTWVKFVVDEVFNIITESALSGEPVTIHKFGRFVPMFSKGKRCFNPGTREYMESKDKLKLKFKQGSTLTEILQESIS